MAKEFIEVISEQTKAQIDAIMPLVEKLATKIKEINNFSPSNTPSGADKGIQNMNTALKEQALALNAVKTSLSQVNEQKEKSASLTTQQKVDNAIILKQEKQQAVLTSEYAKAYEKLNMQRTIAKQKLQDLIASERASNAEIRKAQKEFDVLNKKVAAADKAVGRFSDANRKINGLSQSVGNLMTAFGVGTGLYLAADILKGIYDTTKALQSLDLALKMVSGSQAEFAANKAFISNMSEKWGVEIKTATEEYTKFYTASKNILKDDEIKSVFESIAKSSSIMGASQQKQHDTFVALEQMMSKGKVTAEELTKQLGNAMPGAIRAMAMAYMELHPQVKTIQEAERQLYAEMRKGAIDSATYVPLMVKQFEKLYGIESVNKVETLQAAQNRLKNSWTELVRAFNEADSSGFSRFIGEIFSGLQNIATFTSLLFKNEKQLETFFMTMGKGKGLEEYTAIMNNIATTSKENIEATKKELLFRERETIRVNQAIIKSEKEKRASLTGGNRAFMHLQTKAEEDALVQLAKSAEIIRNIKNEGNKIVEKPKQGIKAKTKAEINAELKAEKDGLKAIEDAAKTEYDLKMSSLEQEKFIIEQKMLLKENNYSENLRLAVELAAKEQEIAKAVYDEEVRLAGDSIEKKTIADNKYYKEKIKLAIDAIEKIDKIQYNPQYKDTGALADEETYGIGTFELGKENMKFLIDSWNNHSDKKQKDQEEELERLKAMRSLMNEIFDDFGEETGFGNTMDVFAKVGKNGKTFWENLTGGEEGVIEMRDSLFAGLAVMEDVVGKFEDAEEERYQRRLARLEKEKEVALSFAGDSAAAKAKIEADYDKKKKELELKAFKRQKAIALANIAINTAQAVMSVLSTGGGAHYLDFGVSAGILSAFVTAAGLAQAVMVMSQKPPEYWKGTDNAEAGLAWTNERGAEIITDKHGHIKDYGDNKGARLSVMEKGDKVYNAEQTKKLMFNNELNSIMMDNGIGNAPPIVVNSGMTKAEMREVMIETLGGQPKVVHNVDKNGFHTYIEKNGNITRRAEQRGSGNGLTF